MDNVHIAYKPRPDATSDSELATLAAVYAFVLECHAKRTGPAQSSQDQGRGDYGSPLVSVTEESMPQEG